MFTLIDKWYSQSSSEKLLSMKDGKCWEPWLLEILKVGDSQVLNKSFIPSPLRITKQYRRDGSRNVWTERQDAMNIHNIAKGKMTIQCCYLQWVCIRWCLLNHYGWGKGPSSTTSSLIHYEILRLIMGWGIQKLSSVVYLWRNSPCSSE